MKELYELKEMLCEELKEYGKKGELTTGSLEVVDKLAHTVKNLDKIIEAYEEGESGFYPYAYEGGSSRGSYARGNRGSNRGSNRGANRGSNRGSYARDGRYSSEGYSRNDMADRLRDMMQDAPDERTRMEIQRLVEKMENM